MAEYTIKSKLSRVDVRDGVVVNIFTQVDWEGHYEEREEAYILARVQCLPTRHPDWRDAAYSVQVQRGERLPAVLVELRADGLEELNRRFLKKEVGFEDLRKNTSGFFWGA